MPVKNQEFTCTNSIVHGSSEITDNRWKNYPLDGEKKSLDSTLCVCQLFFKLE